MQPQQKFPYLNLNLSGITKRNGLGHGSILKYSNAKCLFKVMALQNTANKLKISVSELKIMCFVLAVVNKNIKVKRAQKMTCEAHEISTLLPLMMVIIKVKEAEKKTEKDRALVKEGCNQIRWL